MTRKNYFFTIQLLETLKNMGVLMKVVRFIALILIVVGAINWGLWGAFQYDIIQDILGPQRAGIARFIYILVGLAGIYGISFFFGCCCKHHKCDKEMHE